MAWLPGGRARRPMTFLSCWFTWKEIEFHDQGDMHDPRRTTVCLVGLLFSVLVSAFGNAQEASPPVQAVQLAQPKQVLPSEQVSSAQIESDLNEGQQSSSVITSLDASSLGSTVEVKQSRRILWIFPNYRTVSADTQLPPLSLKEKFWLATQDSFDYSSFVFAGMIAGASQANKS